MTQDGDQSDGVDEIVPGSSDSEVEEPQIAAIMQMTKDVAAKEEADF